MLLECFLEFTGGSPTVVGESNDSEFKTKKAVEALTFTMTAGAVDETPEAEVEREFGQSLDPDMPFYVKPGKVLPIAKNLSYSIPFTITKWVDRSSPALFINYCKVMSGQKNEFSKVKVSFRKDGGVSKDDLVYLVLEFERVQIVGYKLQLDKGQNQYPKETITFRFTAYNCTYTPQSASGMAGRSNQKGYNLAIKSKK